MPTASSNPFSQFFANIGAWFSRFSLFTSKNIPHQSFLKNHKNEYTKDDIARLKELFQPYSNFPEEVKVILNAKGIVDLILRHSDPKELLDQIIIPSVEFMQLSSENLEEFNKNGALEQNLSALSTIASALPRVTPDELFQINIVHIENPQDFAQKLYKLQSLNPSVNFLSLFLSSPNQAELSEVFKNFNTLYPWLNQGNYDFDGLLEYQRIDLIQGVTNNPHPQDFAHLITTLVDTKIFDDELYREDEGSQILSALLKSPFLHAKELTASVNTLKREGIHIGEILKILKSPYPQQAEMIANSFSIIAPNPQEPQNTAYYEKFGSPNDEFSIRPSFFYDTLAQSDLPVGLALMIKKAILKETQPLTQESAQRIIDTITKPKKSIGPAILSSGSPAIKPGSTQSSKPPKETDQLDASESTTQKSRR